MLSVMVFVGIVWIWYFRKCWREWKEWEEVEDRWKRERRVSRMNRYFLGMDLEGDEDE